MVQEHKLRDRSLENLENRLMLGHINWILEATPRKRTWLNPSAVGKRGVDILITNKFVKFVTSTSFLYDKIVVWVKFEGIEGEDIVLTCIFAHNIYPYIFMNG